MGRGLELGAVPLPGGGVRFRVWAPLAGRVAVEHAGACPARRIPLRRTGSGYHVGAAADLRAGDRYFYVLDGRERSPDPASRFQPLGIDGPSEIVDLPAFAWDDADWSPVPPERLIIYELHIGAFTREGTFGAAIHRLDDLRKLGVTAVELMPVAQFPGERNWGYDGVFPFAPQNSYGGPRGLQSLVDACHRRGLAVILDVVYNHLGPEGNGLGRFGPYFADKYRTPWGPAVNLDGPGSDEVRDFLIANALHWIRDYHADGLRLDAVHHIYDSSGLPFLRQLAEAVHALGAKLGRPALLLAESDLNDARIIRPPEAEGFGLDGVWNDDFHHALHVLLTGEKTGYYQDFGGLEPLAKALREGFVFTGQYSPYRNRRHGSSSADRPARQFIVFSQNHDQVGNRPAGDRLAATQPLDKLKLAAGLVLLSPCVPLLFMGEEYGEDAPFLYFVNYGDERLAEAVRAGRRAEVGGSGPFPDPLALSSFSKSKLVWAGRSRGRHRDLLDFYRRLIRLRKSVPPLAALNKENTEIKALAPKVLAVRRWRDHDEVLCLFNLGPRRRRLPEPFPPGNWRKVFDSSPPARGRAGASARTLPAWSLRVYRSLPAAAARPAAKGPLGQTADRGAKR